MLEEAGKVAEEVLAPLNAIGDPEGCHLENGVVLHALKASRRPSTRCRDGRLDRRSTATRTYGGQGMPTDGPRWARFSSRPIWPSTCIRV